MTKKIKAELEFDDPAFLTVYQELARRKGISLGRLAALALQHNMHMHLESDTEFTRWARKQIRKELHKFTYVPEEYLMT